MSRPLTVFLPVAAAREQIAHVLVSDPSTWLPGGAREAGPGRWHVALEGAGLTRTVVCTVGDPWQASEGLWRRIHWEPIAEEGDVLPMERLLPTFEGEIGVHTAPDGGTSMVLTGTYDVPASRVGELVDLVLLGRVARATANRFLSAIARNLAVGLTRTGR